MDFIFFIDKYGSVIILFFIIIFAFTNIPIFFMSIFTWIILFIMVFQLTRRWDVGLLLATAFLILLLIFRYLGNNNQTLGKSLFIENFDGEKEEISEKEEVLDKEEVSDKEVNQEVESTNISKKNISNISESNVPDVSPQEVKNDVLNKLTDESVGNIVSMENENIFGTDNLENAQEDDILNNIADSKTDDEESDEDSSDSEEENEEVFAKGNKRKKTIGKTKKSKKNAYKAQKDLYNLVNTTKLLKSTLDSMAPALSNGKKIMEKMQSLGIGDMGKI